MLKKQIAWCFSCLTLPAFAEVEVGKHVASNLNPLAMIASLLLVLGLIVVLAFVLKKLNITPMPQRKGIKVITSLHLSGKEKLVVVQVGEKQLLLGVTAQQINLLETLEKPLEQPAELSQDWVSSLQKIIKKS